MADEFDPYYTWLGIRPEEQPADHYRLIGIRQFEENADVISNAMDRQMQFLRGLQVGKRSALSQKLLNEISAAGGCLLDPKRKGAYDKELKSKAAAKAQTAQPALKAGRPIPKAAALPAPPKPAPLTAPLPEADLFSLPLPQSTYVPPSVATPRSKSEPMSQLPLIVGGAAGGVVVLLLVVVVVGRMISGGGKTTVKADKENESAELSGQAPQTSGSGGATSPVKKTETPAPNAVATSTTGKEPPVVSKALIEPDQGTGSSGGPWWTDPRQLDRLMALELTGEATAEFPDTASQVNLTKPFTAELWLRLTLKDDQPVEVFGTRTGSPGAGSQPQGWAVVAQRLPGGKAEFRVELPKQNGETVKYATPLDNGEQWHYVALTFDPQGMSQLFVNGKPAIDIPAMTDLSAMERDLKLGTGKSNRPPTTSRAEICGFRLSVVPRYTAPFIPPSPLEAKPGHQTLAALDCQLGASTRPPAAPQNGTAAWKYGMGRLDPETKRIVGFEPLRHFAGIEWQAGPERPDPSVGWIALDALGGHAGNDADHAAIRRWTAPQDGTLTIKGRLWHAHETHDGDGVRGYIASSRSGILGEWSAYFSEAKTDLNSVPVQAGETIDFAVDCGLHAKSDNFEWTVDFRLADAKGSPLGVWNSAADFSGGPKPGAAAWQYGVGKFDESAKRVAGFEPLRHWTGSHWQVGIERPDKDRGWVCVDALGGSDGTGLENSAVRRWTAPQSGKLLIAGDLRHEHEKRMGDGIRGRIVSSRAGVLGEWKLFYSTQKTALKDIDVEAGDQIDFFVDCIDNFFCDAFKWIVDLRLTDSQGKVLGEWNSATDFQGPAPPGDPPLAAKAFSPPPQSPKLSATRWLPLGTQVAWIGWRPPAVAAIGSNPARSDWKPPDQNSTAAFRSLLGTYMYWNDRTKAYPIVNLQVPSKNLWTPEIQDKVRGRVPFEEISYLGTAKIAVPADGMYVLDTENQPARVQIDGQVVTDWDTPKGEIKIAGGIHDFTFEIGSHGGNWMRDTNLALRHKETGEKVPFFNSWQDIQKFLATPIAGQRVTEVSGWQPSPGNELKIDDRKLASAGVKQSAARPAVPDAAALAEARKNVSEIFRDDLKKAKTPVGKQDLAKKMLGVAKETSNPAQRFALLEEVRKLAEEVKDAPLAASALDAQAADFEIDALAEKVKLLEKLSGGTLTPRQRSELISAAMSFGDAALAAGKTESLPALIGVLRSLSAKNTTPELKTEAQAFIDSLAQRQKQAEALRQAEQKLAVSPDDPEVNLVVGLQMYFVRKDNHGLTLVAKGSNPKLAVAAKVRLAIIPQAKASTTEEADAWYDAIAAAPGEYKSDVQRQAQEGYKFLAATLTGPERLRAQQRLDQVTADIGATLRLSDLPKSTPGMIGRVQVGGKDAGYLVTHRPPGELRQARLEEILAQTKARSARLILVGTLHCDTPGNFRIFHLGRAGGPAQLVSIDGKQVSAVGGSFDGGGDTRLTLSAGDHVIQWVCDFDLSAKPRIDLAFSTGGEEQQFKPFVTQRQMYDARKIPTKQEITVAEY